MRALGGDGERCDCALMNIAAAKFSKRDFLLQVENFDDFLVASDCHKVTFASHAAKAALGSGKSILLLECVISSLITGDLGCVCGRETKEAAFVRAKRHHDLSSLHLY